MTIDVALLSIAVGLAGVSIPGLLALLWLRERRRRLDMADLAADWFWETDARLRFLHVSDRFFDLTGFDRSRWPTIDTLGLSDTFAQWQAHAKTSWLLPNPERAGRPPPFVAEVDITGPNGIDLAFTLTAHPVRGLGGRFRGLRGCGTNVSDSKRFVLTMAMKAAQFRAAIATMPNGIAMFDDDLRVVVHNQRFLDLWGLTLADLDRYPRLPDLVRMLALRGDYGPGDIETLVAQRLTQIIKTPKPSFELKRPDGRVLEIRCHGHTDVGYVLTYLDVTERWQAEEQLRESEQRLRRILEDSPIGISIIRPDWSRLLYVNRRMLALHGGEPADAATLPLAETFVDPADFERARTLTARGKIATGVEVLRCRRDGTVWWALTDLTPITYEGGPAYIAWHYDITERKQAERAFQALDERLQFALHNTGACVWDMDLVSGNRWYSEQVRELMGYTPEELAACRFTITGFAHPEDHRRILGALRRHLSGQDAEFRVEYRARHRSGQWVWLETVGRVVRAADGRPVRFVGTFMDITARRRTEAELMRSERMAALGRLVAGVAHEINNPIGIGVGIASHLHERAEAIRRSFRQGELTQEEFETFLEALTDSTTVMLSNLQRGAELVRSFKQVAVDQSSGARREIRLRTYIEEVLRSLRPKFRGQQHSIEVQCPDDLTILTHPGALSQILTNFIDNSLIHGFETMSGGEIKLTARVLGPRLELVYTDNGRGMAPAEVDQIFEPFFTTKRGQGGSGLGMHVVFNLVTQTLGGTIACESRPNHGILLRLEIPLTGGGAS